MIEIEYDKILKEYEEYFQPVIFLDSDFHITYKNAAAKIVNLKPRVGTNIIRYMDCANIEKLCAAVEKGEWKIVKLDVASPIKRCVVIPVSESVIVFIFFDALNLLNDGEETESDIIKEAEEIIRGYSEEQKNIIKENQIRYSPENIKRRIRSQEHFHKHMLNLNPQNNSAHENKYENYCDIGRSLNNFASGVSPYIKSFGYKIAFKIEDRMYLYKLNKDDLMTINFILATFAFKYSIFNRLDIFFFSDSHMTTLQYEFRAGSDFAETHKDMFVKNYIKELNDIRYLDLTLAALLAKNNDLKLNVYFDSDGGKVCMDLLFYNKPGNIVESNSERPDYITIEDVQERVEIEFAGI